jgi:FG-GAP repeat protein
MGKLRVLAVPAALALVLIGSAGAPGTRASDSSPVDIHSSPAGEHAPNEQHGSIVLQPGTRPIGDFNGDGFADLAVGVPFEDLGGMPDGGAVNVVYGSLTGLVSVGNQFWTQDSADIGDSVEHSDQFGFAATTGDFNVDGFDDLAIGTPLEDPREDSGAVNVIYGSSTGLTSAGNQVWTQDSPGIGDAREPDDQFGRALVGGDFNHDGAADLAIGVPFEDVSKRKDAGGVNVIYGSPSGLGANGNQFWHQGSTGIPGSPAGGDNFGFAVTAGNFNGDSFVDLAVGVPADDPARAGAVNVIFGSASGLSSTGNQLWHQNTAGIAGIAEPGDLFGYSLAGGDFDDDGFADLAIGVPFEDVVKKANGGAASVIYGTAGGLAPSGNQQWSQDSPGIRDATEARDEFGFSLAAGDFNGDKFADLAIGVPGEDPPTNSGAVAVVYGGPSRLSPTRNQLWSQQGLGGSPNEVWDTFGFALVAGRFDDSLTADLAIGAQSEDVLTKIDAGAITVAYGSPSGFQPDGNQYWTQDDLAGLAEGGDRFGYGGDGHPAG